MGCGSSTVTTSDTTFDAASPHASSSFPKTEASVGRFRHQRPSENQPPALTQLRTKPTTDTSDFSSIALQDAEEVSLLQIDGSCCFGRVQVADNSIGWLQLKYLNIVEDVTFGIHQRADGISSTTLRNRPTDERGTSVWTDPKTNVPNGETVRIIAANDNKCWKFLEVVSKNGMRGWLKTEHLSFAVENIADLPDLVTAKKCVEPRASDSPRWMEHDRKDGIPYTSLRTDAKDDASFADGKVLNGEVVEILSSNVNEYLQVRLALTANEGWIKLNYLKSCPEGTRDHKRLAGEGRETRFLELDANDSRFHEIQDLLTNTQCSHPKCHCLGFNIQAKSISFLRNLYLGETGMVTGPKTTLFHGCKDEVVEAITNDGFDDKYSRGGAFGRGIYFSPQSCKACSYAENHILICEVALGSEENRLTLTAPDRTLNHDKVFVQQRKRSAQCHVGAPYHHEERIVFLPTQCKPVYLVKLTSKSPGGGV